MEVAGCRVANCAGGGIALAGGRFRASAAVHIAGLDRPRAVQRLRADRTRPKWKSRDGPYPEIRLRYDHKLVGRVEKPNGEIRERDARVLPAWQAEPVKGSSGPSPEKNSHERHATSLGFVGRSASLYSVIAYLFGSRRARGAQALPQPERNQSAGGSTLSGLNLVPTSRRARGGHSAIRDCEDVLRSHEIAYGRIFAHSHSRDLAVEAVSQKACRATAPRVSPRGPVITQ
jgi:hypothetical protein